MKTKYEKMLNNASDIQYLLNLMEGPDHEWEYVLLNEPFIGRHDKIIAPYTLQYAGLSGRWEYCALKKWEYKFLLKQRTLRSGLATPMARYYGYKALGLSNSDI